MDANQKVLEQLSTLVDNQISPKNLGPTIGKRHFQIVLVFLVTVLNYVIRISFSVIIVAMTDSTSNKNKDIPTYDWTDKSIVVSSFIWGYMIPQIGAGYLSTKYGAKWFLSGSLVSSSILGFLIPTVAANFGSKGVMVLRMLQGLSQGFFFPSCHCFLSKWVPVEERSRLGTLPYLGAPVGTIASMSLTGWIASSWYGWPIAVYAFSGIGLTFGFIFAYFGSSEPDKHSSITEEEKMYIKKSIISANSTQKGKNLPIPWSNILTSLPCWALIIAQIGWSWKNWILLLETPIYMNHVMKFDLKSNGALSSLPYIAEALSAVCYSFIADFLIVKKVCSIGTTRKIMNFIGMIFPGIALLLLANCSSNDTYKAVTLLVLVGMTTSATRSGFNVNQMDLAPNFAGILMGLSNGISACTSSLGPLIIQLLVKDENNPQLWKQVFYISAVIVAVAFIFYLIFGSGTLQSWNEGGKKYGEKQSQKSKC